MHNAKSSRQLSIGYIITTCCVVLALFLFYFYAMSTLFRATIGAKDLNTYLLNLMPNVMDKKDELFKALIQTLQMVGYSALYSASFGIIFGVILVVTQKGGLMDCPPLYQFLDKVINFVRSIPFIILVALLIPVSRNYFFKTSLGVKGAIVPLVIATVPFFSRQIHAALVEVDGGMVEAARSMGLSSVSIIFRVYLKEGLPGIIRSSTITIVNIIALTAMAGTVGAGGLGDFAIRYGYQRVMTDITVVTIAIILLIVTIIQTVGTALEHALSH